MLPLAGSSALVGICADASHVCVVDQTHQKVRVTAAKLCGVTTTDTFAALHVAGAPRPLCRRRAMNPPLLWQVRQKAESSYEKEAREAREAEARREEAASNAKRAHMQARAMPHPGPGTRSI